MSSKGNKRLVKSKSGLKIVAHNDVGVSPWEILEPSWQDDHEVVQCSTPDCSTKFDFIKRRHHCRRCGKVFCSKCCSVKVQLDRMQFVDPVRHCISCAKVTRQEEIFFEQDLKVLLSGAPFSIDLKSGDKELQGLASRNTFYNCKLSADQRLIIFECDGDEGIDVEPISLSKIKDYAIPKMESECGPSEFSISTHSAPKPVQTVVFVCPQGPNKKPSILWLLGLNKALQMIFESRNMDEEVNTIELE
ncbi:zinc finger FYVE domain-containing protein 21 [Lepeophtheirus salmonis]|nr:zinc finger FYVE domain-containing protein 21-like isoform X2 [Lepeophtheirus salmonis]